MKMQPIKRREVALTEEEKETLRNAEIILKGIAEATTDAEMNELVDNVAYHDGSSQPLIEDFTGENITDAADFLFQMGELLFILADVTAFEEEKG